MPKPQRFAQSRLADPNISYKSVRFGSTPVPHKSSSIDEQSTLSQFGFTPSSSAASTVVKKKKRKLIPYGKRGLKRKSINFDDLKAGSSDDQEEEEEDERSPVGKKRRVRRVIVPREVEEENDENDSEAEEQISVIKKELIAEEGEEESWRPTYAPKRQRGKSTKTNRTLKSMDDRTLTQMYPMNFHRSISDSDYEEEDDGEDQDSRIEEESGQEQESEEEPTEEEQELVRVKDEPLSQTEVSFNSDDNEEYIKQEDQQPGITIKNEESEKENIPGDEETFASAADSANPKTPKKPIPNVVPSSYTPPVTPLSPLRHSQLDAIYKSPSVQRLWRLKGIAMPGLSPVVEDQTKEDTGSTTQRTESELIAAKSPLRKPNFTLESASAETMAESPTKDPSPRVPDFIKNKIVPSSQWWDREETWSSNSGRALETVLEVESQPEVQVESSDVPSIRSTTVTPRAQRIVQLEEADGVDVVPESPVSKRSEEFSKEVPTVSEVREPLLRDSSTLNPLYTSFLRKESSTIVLNPKPVENKSQRSEISTRSVDRQLIFESDDYSKNSGDVVKETPLDRTESSDPDATLSQTPSRDSDKTPRAKKRSRTLTSRKESNVPLLLPSSPPQSCNGLHVSETPRSSKDIFHSPSSKISTSPTINFTRRSSDTYEPQEQYLDDMNETLDSYRPPRAIETLSQWKLREFGPSQAVPTISQFFPAGFLAEDDDDEDEDEEL
ncbi:hypothetical protein H072_4076 [Dactylellina haptotyla CBS 200.50]|uniref:Uncharacterized protein n=1 Tax=Dactylellina haptotyla (strain CBS 200.50) TaxID=1284197 RepID=S8C2X7_DACHA|nr:hypothetical protein H072_4076 [Dactylellina haptotyla CBS 200.50]